MGGVNELPELAEHFPIAWHLIKVRLGELMTYIAQDTFVAETTEGAPLMVAKGAAFPDNHPLVRLDQDGAGVLFKPMDDGGAKPAAKSQPAKAGGKS